MGERCKLPQQGLGGPRPQSHFAALYPPYTVIVCSQNASGCSISGSLVSIAISGKMKASPGSGRMWNLLAIYAFKKVARPIA